MAEGLRVRGGKRVTLGRDNGQLGRKSFSQLVVRALPEGSRQNYSLEVHFDDARFKDSGGSWRDGGRAFFLRLADRPEYCFTIKAGGLKEPPGPLCCCLPFCCSPFAAAGSKSLGVDDTVCVFYNFRGANQVFKYSPTELTISPDTRPDLVLGVQADSMVLVHKSDVDRVLQFQFDFNDQEAVVVTNPMLAVVPAYPVAAPRPVEQESS